ncbi:MAG TPA: SBBP repeat-containing protein [Archangium sp.]|uniref:SBBP repeat-containing protein n=1 Tax=Archangium sp. TaxID=1872627 RepID=UPI002E30C121|nr:SBBP repeat-containing protein [Archangium sp.]HEX5753624.1 SBBP repeat-containing protein [Archangium sp.]
MDGSGNAYVASWGSAGETVTKINAAGTSILYSVSLGWSDVSGIQVDSAGHAYVVGSVNAGQPDVAVGKLNPSGTAFVYAVTLGGSGSDEGTDIALDTAGNAYITGATSSWDFPVVNAFQPTQRGGGDAFIAKLNATGTALSFSTYLGGQGGDQANAIAVDSSGNAYVTGTTLPPNDTAIGSFPTTPGSAQPTVGGWLDAFVAKFDSTGSRVYASYIGGSAMEMGYSIAVSGSGIAYVAGLTESTNFPTTSSAYQTVLAPGDYGSAFVVQLSPTGNAYTYSTLLGGNSSDHVSSIAVNASGTVFVTGTTWSTNFPTNVYADAGSSDAFVTRFNGP